jgi:hypothetical protein
MDWNINSENERTRAARDLLAKTPNFKSRRISDSSIG